MIWTGCIAAAAMCLLIATASAGEENLCRAIALFDVAAVDNPDSILARGDYATDVTMYRENKHSGLKSLCEHGGYCYPVDIERNGQKVEALHLINCAVGQRAYEDEDEMVYSLNDIRALNGSSDLRRSDLARRFSEMGLCVACSDNVTEFYLNAPASPCAQLAKQALEGNPEATDQLKAFPEYCHWQYGQGQVVQGGQTPVAPPKAAGVQSPSLSRESKVRQMALIDLKLDYAELSEGTEIDTSGYFQQVGSVAQLESKILDMQPIFLMTDDLGRDDKKILLTNCSDLEYVCFVEVQVRKGCQISILGQVSDAPCMVVEKLSVIRKVPVLEAE